MESVCAGTREWCEGLDNTISGHLPHVITSYPELSSHTQRRMGRQPGQRQPPESRSVTVCGHTASITLHKDGVLFDDAKFDLIHNMSTKQAHIQFVWIAAVQSIVETDGEKEKTKTFVTH